MKKTVALVLALLMVFCFFAACGEKKAADGKGGKTDTQVAGNYAPNTLREMTTHPSDDAKIRVCYGFTMVSLTQLGHQLDQSGCFTYANFEPLMQWDSINNRIAPSLAESWEWLDDTTLRVHLYEGIKSIAGDPFTANDVLWTYKFYQESGLMGSYFNVLDLEKTKVVDDLTIDIVTTGPYPYLTLDMCANHWTLGCEKTAKDIAYNEATGTWDQDKLDWDPSFGTGPYKIVKLDPQHTWIEYERNEDYWNATKPYYKYMNVYSVTDPETRAMGIEAGDYDFVIRINAASGNALKDNDNFNVYTLSSLGQVVSFRFNTNNEKLKNKELRQAIVLSIDYDSLCEIVYDGASVPAYDFIPNTSEYYTEPDDATNFIRYDPDLAKQKIAEAGYPNGEGIEIDFIYSTGTQTSSKIAECLQYMIKDGCGVKVNVKPTDNSTYFDFLRAGDWEMTMGDASNPNPRNHVTKLDPSLNFGATLGWVGTGWYDDLDKIQDLCDRCSYSVDDADRMQAYADLQAIVREYVPMIIMIQPQNTHATIKDIIGFTLTSYGNPNMAWFYPAEYITG